MPFSNTVWRFEFPLNASVSETVNGIVVPETKTLSATMDSGSSMAFVASGFEIDLTTGAIGPIGGSTVVNSVAREITMYTAPEGKMGIVKFVATNVESTAATFSCGVDYEDVDPGGGA